jgi:signal transduction histidine kinase
LRQSEEARSACQPQDACREVATTVAKRSAPAPAELAQRRTAEPGAANEELQTFTYPVAHALESPLHGIDGDSRRLLDSHYAEPGEEGRLFLAKLRNAVAHSAPLIEDLPAYSRLERRKLQARELVVERDLSGPKACADATTEHGAA